ncbi:MAG: metal-dependent hydrolase [Alicyclobacillaceae bacterium]|uniref:metal-dependent hydrolase n=1 Tax=Alicyclobacillus sp. SP_1 TaxID=2942475 RepID=UPI0021586090|nr:metal-dependent hydrolase [Alicyclobacillus sp. SP_1]MCY0888605.1 metal-dependent hydrolase [Alicyclobacillaceae bacterium]
MKITYHGQSTFLVEANGHAVIIDPFLSGNPKAVLKPEDVKVDAVLLSHGHGDHILDAEQIAKQNDAVLIAPNELAVYFGSKGVKVHPMHIGGAHQFPFGRVKLTLAFHGSGIDSPDGFLYAGMPSGILLTMGEKTLYHAGDTALFGDMKLIGDRNAIDVALLPIGDNFTMGPEDAVYAAELIHAKHTVPMHYNTFDLIAQDPHAFVRELEIKGLAGHVLEYGQSLEV